MTRGIACLLVLPTPVALGILEQLVEKPTSDFHYSIGSVVNKVFCRAFKTCVLSITDLDGTALAKNPSKHSQLNSTSAIPASGSLSQVSRSPKAYAIENPDQNKETVQTADQLNNLIKSRN
eukprot:gnl/MRDRNA2_/MRDRNA2_26288_c0_seq2.p1 gnl/MRDRNA2_/MRDRNA2_26288_c0~~gnl/MRDRNA2_/MRDRNA2_26288_c0_seq2.p1  ORF type:complete len:121 (-),score=12.05 gnl/MRDRNA2_/MRDRNA2_26288_c0_seq2:182-544(-)